MGVAIVSFRIVVLVKQVPATTEVKVDPVTNNLVREGVRSTVNPFDLYALEEGLRLREVYGAELIAVTMGPPQATNAMKYCLGLGYDQAVLLSDRVFAGSDTWATALVLSAAMRRIGPDLILCGKMASDGDTAQVPPEMAEHLRIPCVTLVSRTEYLEEGTATVLRTLSESEAEVAVSLPAVLTMEKGANNPRYPTLQGIADTADKRVDVWRAADLGVNPSQVGALGSPTQVVKVMPARTSERGVVLEGILEAQLQKIVRILKESGALNHWKGAGGHE